MANASNSKRSSQKSNSTGSGNRNTSSSGKRSSSSGSSKKSNSSAKNNKKYQQDTSDTYIDEIILIVSFALMVFLFLCTVGIIGTKPGADHLNFGDYIQFFMLGLFGITGYVVPVVAFVSMILRMANRRNNLIWWKIGALIAFVIIIGMFAHLIAYKDLSDFEGSMDWVKTFYESRKGGGVIWGAFALGLNTVIGKVGSVFLLIVCSLIAFVALTGKSFIKGVKNGSKKLYQVSKEERERIRRKREAELEEEEDEAEEVLPRQTKRKAKSYSGITSDTLIAPQPEKNEPVKNEVAKKEDIPQPVAAPEPQVEPVIELACEEVVPEKEKQDIHPVVFAENDEDEIRPVSSSNTPAIHDDEDFLKPVNSSSSVPTLPVNQVSDMEEIHMESEDDTDDEYEFTEDIKTAETFSDKPVARLRSRDKASLGTGLTTPVKDELNPQPPKEYKFPPVSLLRNPDNGGKKADGDDLAATAKKLEETLETFGVRVKVTNYSKGPAVTRYELQPEQGVKVSKILSLSDDIKLNLAASDIRIEAPIPGKMAVGIEVPNQSSTAVSLRELVDNAEFKNFNSNLAFAVGKDIGGNIVLTDIAKMPHVLIAGATGSGKSVCINTLIMSILYKAHPDDVKMIMIDPKVVELNVYNGIPHLMIPVVTDPKKASAALAWGVAEMTERYKKFADSGVRDLKGYNQKAAQNETTEDGIPLKKMPQIVIIVDELADLMMVASKEVEESICRLAQLARAAGIHLIIATQRPSVDVITGLIKANMPSRIAFSVTSGIDSRTILDSNGAEKLLGKGDMLFFPQGQQKPSRVQGCFVSDDEVVSVVDFIKNQSISNDYGERAEEILAGGNSGGESGFHGGDEQDSYFAEAGRFVIEKEKGSIGMLQRVFKIGFNRAARIMDQLEAAGVVGPEEGTKPRRIIMTAEEFEAYLSNR